MTAGRSELEPPLYDAIAECCARGDKLVDAGEFDEAITEYEKAWKLVPEPKNEWSASTWILTAIADASFLGGYKITAREALEYALTCPDALGNPFIHLRYGQVLLDAGEADAAAEELTRAYMGAGEEIFASEDPRYLSFLKSRAQL